MAAHQQGLAPEPHFIFFQFLELADCIQTLNKLCFSVKQALPLTGYRSLLSIQGEINRYLPLSNTAGPQIPFSCCLERGDAPGMWPEARCGCHRKLAVPTESFITNC